MKVYYWNARPNFGDSIAPLLLEHFSDGTPVYAPAADSEVIVTGSILHHMPANWRGTVLGAGSLYTYSKVPAYAKYLAVRGPMTLGIVAAYQKVRDIALGDPGLLAGELVGPQPRTTKIGVVPHWSDHDLWYKELSKIPATAKIPLLIDPAGDPLEVIRQIGSCNRIVASSLHGIILADAFGIPRRIEMTPQFVKEGGDHKFRDHCAAVSVPFEVGKWQSPVFSRVEDRQHELYDAFRTYGNYYRRQQWATRGTESVY